MTTLLKLAAVSDISLLSRLGGCSKTPGKLRRDRSKCRKIPLLRLGVTGAGIGSSENTPGRVVCSAELFDDMAKQFCIRGQLF